jgi:hypothetical protein
VEWIEPYYSFSETVEQFGFRVNAVNSLNSSLLCQRGVEG